MGLQHLPPIPFDPSYFNCQSHTHTTSTQKQKVELLDNSSVIHIFEEKWVWEIHFTAVITTSMRVCMLCSQKYTQTHDMFTKIWKTVVTCNHESPQNNTQTRACVSQGIRSVCIWEFEPCVSRNSNRVCLVEFQHLPWCRHHASYFSNQTNNKVDESVICSMLLVDLYSYNCYITTSMCVFMLC